MRRLAILFAAFMAMSCADSLDSASFVKKTRAIAARVEVTGASERANPRPGEGVSVTTRVIGPGAKPVINWGFVACVPQDTAFGVPLCDAERIIVACTNCEGGPEAVDPTITFDAPSAEVIGEAEELLVLGAICEGGPVAGIADFEALFAEQSDSINGCAGGAGEGPLVFHRIPLETSEMVNEHPEIAEVTLNGAVWVDIAPPDASTEGCLGAGFPERVAGIPPLVVRVTPSPTSRQETDDGTEELLISWFATGGEFDESFDFIDDDHPFGENAWIPPLVAGEGGTLVRFHFVMRDGRGGTDWTERALCVVE